MDDIELLDWQFRIAKMGRSELEVTLRAMADPDAKPFSLHDPEAVARLARQSLIGSTEAMLNRVPSNVGSGPGIRRHRPRGPGIQDNGKIRLQPIHEGAAPPVHVLPERPRPPDHVRAPPAQRGLRRHRAARSSRYRGLST